MFSDIPGIATPPPPPPLCRGDADAVLPVAESVKESNAADNGEEDDEDVALSPKPILNGLELLTEGKKNNKI